MKVSVRGNDLDFAIRKLKRKIIKEGDEHYAKLRAIPKPSERRKAKERTAIARRRNQLKREGTRNGY